MFTNNYKLFKLYTFKSAVTYFNATDLTGTSFRWYYTNASYAFGDLGRNMRYARCRTLLTGESNAGTGGVDLTYSGVYFGTGSTPATEDDYTLESPITSGLSIDNSAAAVVQEINDAGQWLLSSRYILTNTTDQEIVIREVGLFGAALLDSNDVSKTSTWKLALLERTVLSEPITIAPGKAKLVTYKVVYG